MDKITGIVLETGENDCLVLATGNRYVRLQRPDNKPQIGDTIEGFPVVMPRSCKSVPRFWSYVASILLTILIGGSAYVYTAYAAPVAYVSLDVGSSFELAINSKGKVTKINSYDSRGSVLLEKAQLENLPVAEALKNLVNVAAEEEKSVDAAVITYTESPLLDENQLNKLTFDTLQDNQFSGQLLSQTVDRDFRGEAAESHLSPGKLLVLELANSSNVSISPEDLRGKNVAQALKEHNLTLSRLLPYKAGVSSQHSPSLHQIGPATPSTGENGEKEPKKVSQATVQKKTSRQTQSLAGTRGKAKGHGSGSQAVPADSLQGTDNLIVADMTVEQTEPQDEEFIASSPQPQFPQKEQIVAFDPPEVNPGQQSDFSPAKKKPEAKNPKKEDRNKAKKVNGNKLTMSVYTRFLTLLNVPLQWSGTSF